MRVSEGIVRLLKIEKADNQKSMIRRYSYDTKANRNEDIYIFLTILHYYNIPITRINTRFLM
jgi:hypothetical protein